MILEGGLGNRMRVAAAAYAMSRRSGIPFRVLWTKQWGMHCRFDELFKSVTSLYRLDQRSVTAADGASLGPLPGEARALLTVLGAAWCGIALYALGELLKNKREKR